MVGQEGKCWKQTRIDKGEELRVCTVGELRADLPKLILRVESKLSRMLKLRRSDCKAKEGHIGSGDGVSSMCVVSVAGKR
ncbi:hypothetical protein ACLOJK_014177 [Asimina triloba]